MKRIYCPQCKRVKRTWRNIVPKSMHPHVTAAGKEIDVPVAKCLRHEQATGRR